MNLILRSHQFDNDLESPSRSRSTKNHQQPCTGFVLVLTIFAAVGGFLFGYDTGVVSGAMLLLRQRFVLTPLWQELVVTATVGAAALSTLLGGLVGIADILGRRMVILVSATVFAVGSVLLASSGNREMLLLGRVVVGLGIGMASVTVPVYIAESSPPTLRGRLVTVNTLFITGGQFCASVVDGAFSNITDGWRYMLGLAVIPAVIQFIGFLFLPESPRWLAKHGRLEDARLVLTNIIGSDTASGVSQSASSDTELDEPPLGLVEMEMQSIQASLDTEKAESHSKVLSEMLRHMPTRRALILGCSFQIIQQFCGINTVMYYSATIIQMAGVRDNSRAIWIAAGVAFTNFLGSIIGVWLVERVGRRVLTLTSLIGTLFGLMVLGGAFLFAALTSPPVSFSTPLAAAPCSQYKICDPCMQDPVCGFCYSLNVSMVVLGSCDPAKVDGSEGAISGRCSNGTENNFYYWAYNYCPTPYAWLAVLGMVMYLLAFAPGMGTMPWTVNAEIYPLWARGTGNSASATVNWLSNVVVSLTFLHLAEYLKYFGVFFLYLGLSFLGFIFLALTLPETRGRSLEEVQQLFSTSLYSCTRKQEGSNSEGSQVAYSHLPGVDWDTL
uniref:Solute carrier family 2 member 13b n=1 Tax=Eptatretus burgeri TaxID=7764 RepID=A0A8C4NEC6_EPTBU